MPDLSKKFWRIKFPGYRMTLKHFHDIKTFDVLICLDTEWTCWQDSLELGWPDPERPPEIIQIGLASYDTLAFSLLNTFDSLVVPKLNPLLSEYCTDLLSLKQSDLDQAETFPQVSENLTSFLSVYKQQKVLICSFGHDWEHFSLDAKRNSISDPISRFSKMDLRLELSSIFDIPYRETTREVIVERLNLAKNPRRHEALFDAYQLIDIIQGLSKMSRKVSF